METYYIYKLIDPRDNAIRYVGKTLNMEGRVGTHYLETAKGYAVNILKHIWLSGLYEAGLQPKCELITTAEGHKAGVELEAFYMRSYVENGERLLNICVRGQPRSAAYARCTEEAKIAWDKYHMPFKWPGRVVKEHNLSVAT